METIKLPAMKGPKAELCWKQPPLDSIDPNPMVHCDRRVGHTGLHSWEVSAPVGSPPPPDIFDEERRLLKLTGRVASEIAALVNKQPFADIESLAVERVIMRGLYDACAASAPRGGGETRPPLEHEEKELARGGTQADRDHLQSSAAKGKGL